MRNPDALDEKLNEWFKTAREEVRKDIIEAHKNGEPLDYESLEDQLIVSEAKLILYKKKITDSRNKGDDSLLDSLLERAVLNSSD